MREISSGLGSVASRASSPLPPAARLGSVGPEDVVDEEDADQVVEIVVHHREAAVPRRAHRLGDVLGVHRDGQERDVDPRRHDLAHVHVAEIGEGFGDEPLLFGGLSLERLARAVRLPGPVGVDGAAPQSS